MKVIALLISFLTVASAFAPLSTTGRSSTAVKALFDDVSVFVVVMIVLLTVLNEMTRFAVKVDFIKFFVRR